MERETHFLLLCEERERLITYSVGTFFSEDVCVILRIKERMDKV